MKKTDKALVASLSRAEIQTLIDFARSKNRIGRARSRDAPLAFSAGLRVSELVGLQLDQLDLRIPCAIRVIGKGGANAYSLCGGKRGSTQGLARRPGAKARWSTISQRRWSHDDAVRVRIHSRAHVANAGKRMPRSQQTHNTACSAT